MLTRLRDLCSLEISQIEHYRRALASCTLIGLASCSVTVAKETRCPPRAELPAPRWTGAERSSPRGLGLPRGELPAFGGVGDTGGAIG